MAVPQWKSLEIGEYVEDPADQCSWMFKIEQEGTQIKLHQWKCKEKRYALYCDKTYGPSFGYEEEYLNIYSQQHKSGNGSSMIAANNKYYQKFDLAAQMNNGKNLLLFQLKKTMNIDCPSKVIGERMSEEHLSFSLNECEVFAIKK